MSAYAPRIHRILHSQLIRPRYVQRNTRRRYLACSQTSRPRDGCIGTPCHLERSCRIRFGFHDEVFVLVLAQIPETDVLEEPFVVGAER
jgi:hypothetical protein